MFKFYLFFLSVGITISVSAQNDFTLLASPEGGPCTKMAQADNGDLYLLSRGGTLYRSSDHGENWIELPYAGAAFVDFAILDSKILAIDSHNVYTSSDQGSNFSQLFYFSSTQLTFIRALPNNKVLLFGLDFADNTDYYPLFVSVDAGQNWTLTNPNVTSVLSNYSAYGFQSVFIAPDGKTFVSTLLGDIVSSDEGQTFAFSRGVTNEYSRIAFDATSIYAITNTDFVRSDDQGQNWLDIKNGLPSPYYGGFIAVTSPQEIIWISPSLLSQQVYISTDGGDHWSPQGVLPNFGEEFFNLYSFQNELFLLGSSGVYGSLDKGKSWSGKNTGIHAQEYKDMVLVNSKLFFVTESTLYSKNYADVNWVQFQLPFVYGDYNYNFPLYLKDLSSYGAKNLLIHGANNYDFIDSLGNDSWNVIKKDYGSHGNGEVSTIVRHDTVFSVAQGVAEINELLPNSSVWKPVVASWLGSNSSVNAIVDTQDNHILVAYQNSSGNSMLAKLDRNFQFKSQTQWNYGFQMVRLGSKIFAGPAVSNDNGETWNYTSLPADYSSKYFFDQKGRLFLGMDGKFQYSLDTAKTWTSFTLDNNLNRVVSGITTDSLGYIYLAVNNKGILKSNFRALKTQAINFQTLSDKTFGDSPFSLVATSSSGLPITFSSSDTTVVKVVGSVATIFSDGSTVITASQSGDSDYQPAASVQQTLNVGKMKVITEDSPTESHIRIYPVPTEKDLNIRYSTPQLYNEFVVDVIDIQGRTILDNLKGTDNMRFDVSSLAPSLYFLRVTSANEVKILKFIKE